MQSCNYACNVYMYMYSVLVIRIRCDVDFSIVSVNDFVGVDTNVSQLTSIIYSIIIT